MLWKWIFWTVLMAYLLLYAPFGINESDGGFMTGYAWQWLCGKQLYSEVMYVRPPVPVWLRAFEIYLLPESWQVLGERWIFFLKIAAYAWLAADILWKEHRWQLATFIFVVSVHCYPPASLHTFDGLLFSVLAVWLFSRKMWWQAGVVAVVAAFCKQSFYLTPALIFGMALFQRDAKILGKTALGTCTALAVLAGGMVWAGNFDDLLRRTGGASSFGKLWEQGFLNLLRVNPIVAAGTVVFVYLFFKKLSFFKNERQQKLVAVSGLIIWLSATYVFQVWHRQAFTVPVAQSRILFWIAAGWAVERVFFQKKWLENLPFLAFLSLTWACTVSWGYSFPIQFAAPGVFVLAKILDENTTETLQKSGSVALLLLLLLIFRVGYEYTYRDGQRSEMSWHIGSIFPKAQGVFSDRETFDKYMEIKVLWEKYAGGKVVMPWFCQAHFLMDDCPALPAEWIANREINSDTTLIFNILEQKRPTVFLEKSMLPLILDDPEHTVSRHIFRNWQPVAEGEFYWVYQFSFSK